MKLIEYFKYTIIRIIAIIIAIILAYYIVFSIIKPEYFDPLCLTNTNSCPYIILYKYKNSFIGQVFPSGIYIWFNGKQLYVYGQAPGQCSEQNAVPVDNFQISGTDNNTIYTRGNYICINSADNVIDYYRAVLNTEPTTVYLKNKSKKLVTNLNVFDIFEALIQQKIISVANINK